MGKARKSLDNRIKIVYNIFCMDTVGDCLLLCADAKRQRLHTENKRCTLGICICSPGMTRKKRWIE